jgi:hypothetical protein
MGVFQRLAEFLGHTFFLVRVDDIVEFWVLSSTMHTHDFKSPAPSITWYGLLYDLRVYQSLMCDRIVNSHCPVG